MFPSAILKDSLDHSAPVGMDAKLTDVVVYWHYDEVDALGWHLLNALLNHVVAVLVKNAFQY